VAVLVLGSAIRNYKAQTDALKDQAAQLEQENSQLEDKNDKKGTLEGLLEFAKDFLGLIDPDSVIFDSES
jgi:cell division protein FtsB